MNDVERRIKKKNLSIAISYMLLMERDISIVIEVLSEELTKYINWVLNESEKNRYLKMMCQVGILLQQVY